METNRKKRSFNPTHMQGSADRYHLSQALRVGDTIWVSGQVGISAEREIPSGVEAQTRLAFENLRTVLEDAGASLDDVVELTLLVTPDMAELGDFQTIKDEYIRPPYPAVTGFRVSGLASPEFLIEIRAVAVAGAGAG